MAEHRITAWRMRSPGEPMVKESFAASPGSDEVVVEVHGCGVCHTDLGFYYGGVKTKKSPPLALGHEIAGVVIDAGGEAGRRYVGASVVVPAVVTCGQCSFCKAGRPTSCRASIMPGNDIDGGFADRVVIPARKLCVVDAGGKAQGLGQAGLDLWELAVVADAATTPYQAIRRAGLGAGDLAVFIGVGGVGGYGVQIAAALGAHAVAIDIDDAKLEALSRHGAALTVNARGKKPRELRDAIRGFAKGKGLAEATWRIFETSGTAVGQETAFGLLGQGSSLSVVGFTMDTVTLRLSNMMAFDADMHGNWGCDPDLYPEVVGLVLEGKVSVRDFSEPRPLGTINEVFAEAHAGKLQKRVVLRP